MTPDAAADAIEPLIDTWATAQGITVAWPNVNFTPPATANWAKVDFIWGTGAVWTKGVTNGLNAVTAVLQLAVFGPKDGGDGGLSALAETARAVFNRKRLASPNDEVTFGAVSGPVTQFEESWRSLVLSAPFRVVETIP